jgi:O-antigen ligase
MINILENKHKYLSMFHMKHSSIFRGFFYLFLFLIPINLRIIYFPESAYIGSDFSYYLAIMLYFTDIVLIAVLGVWYIITRPRFTGTFYKYSIILLILAIFSLFHVERLDLGLYSLLKWLELFLLVGFIKTQINTKEHIRTSLSILFASAVFQGFIAILQFVKQGSVGISFLGEYIAEIGTPGMANVSIYGEKLVRAHGTFPHPNILAGFLIFGLLIGFYYVSRETIVTKLYVSCGTIVLILGIFFTFTRTAWFLAILAGLGYLVYYLWLKRYSPAITIVIIGIVSCGTIGLFFGDYLKTRSSALTSSSDSVILRQTYSEHAFELIKNKPLLGVGVGNYIPALQDLAHLQSWQYQPAHNIFLVIAVEMGIVGLIVFLLMIIPAGIRFMWNLNNPLALVLFVSFLFFLFLGGFDHYLVTIQQGRLMFFTLIGLMLAYPSEANGEINVQ